MCENTVHCSSAAYPCFDAASVAIYTTGSTFYYLFKERIVIRGHVSLLATFNIAAATAVAVACPCTPPAKTGPRLLLLSRRFRLARPRYPEKEYLHIIYILAGSLVDFTFAIVLSSGLPYEVWRSASLPETKYNLRLWSIFLLKTTSFFAMTKLYLYYFSIVENLSFNQLYTYFYIPNVI